MGRTERPDRTPDIAAAVSQDDAAFAAMCVGVLESGWGKSASECQRV